MTKSFRVIGIGGIKASEVTFRHGVNLIVGETGSGKTSLLNAIRFFCIEGRIPKGAKNNESDVASIECNDRVVSSKNTIDQSVTPLASFMMSDDMPSGDELYFLLNNIPVAELDHDKVMGLSSAWDIKKFMSDGKIQTSQPDTFKMTLEEAQNGAEVSTYDLMNTYVTLMASTYGVADLDLSKLTGKFSTRELLSQPMAWERWGQAIDNVARAAKAKGKREMSEHLEVVASQQTAALKAYLAIQKKVEDEFPVRKGKWVSESGLTFNYLSRGERLVAVSELKKILMQANAGATDLVLLDNFESVTASRSNPIIATFNKLGKELGVYVVIAMAKTIQEFKKKPPAPVYEMVGGVAKPWEIG